MKFKWYHVIYILVIVAIIGVAGYLVYNSKSDTRQQTEAVAGKGAKSSNTSEDMVNESDGSDQAEKTEKAGEDNTGKVATGKDGNGQASDGKSGNGQAGDGQSANGQADDGQSANGQTAEKSGSEAEAAGKTSGPEMDATDKPLLTVELTQDSKPRLSWNEVKGAEYYEIYRYDEKTKKWKKQDTTTGLVYIDNNVADKQTYQYRLYALHNKDDKVIRSEKSEASIKVEFNEVVKALVVDFETSSSKRMVKYLKKAGFQVDRVESIDAFNVDDYDTLVIPGGHNITPSIYGAERDEHTYGTNIEIDKLQIKAVKLFVKAEKPVLGVCRGCQLVNVAMGGTINQHIPGWHKNYRTVKIDRSSWLYPKIGATESVFHYHHQCVEQLGKGLIATQWDEQDEHIEAYQHESLPIYGIQWHPDKMGKQGVDIFKYYKELVIEYYNK